MRIVFFGTSSFAAQILAGLLEKNIDVVAVVTRPDRPKGRSLNLSPPPVKEFLQKIKSAIVVYQPEKASTPEFATTLLALHADLFVVVAFGEIIKQNILDIPKKGCINIHTSLLPKYRGAAPMQRSLMDGVRLSGVSIIEMVPQMDAGDILAVEKTAIAEDMNCGELEEALLPLALSALFKTLHAYEAGNPVKMPQDPLEVTMAPKITSLEEQIDWSRPAWQIHNQIRALSPFPGAWTSILIGNETKRLKIKRSRVIADKSGMASQIISFHKGEWVVACGTEALQLLEVQLEGKKTMQVEDFVKGIHQNISFIK